jgi:Protein of unknown function (DUF3467)
VAEIEGEATTTQLHIGRDSDAEQPAPTYANHVQVTFTPEDFTLYFGWYAVPPLLEPPKTTVEVHVEPMSRVVVPLNLMPSLVALLQRQIEAYEQSFGKLPEHPNKPAWMVEASEE